MVRFSGLLTRGKHGSLYGNGSSAYFIHEGRTRKLPTLADQTTIKGSIKSGGVLQA